MPDRDQGGINDNDASSRSEVDWTEMERTILDAGDTVAIENLRQIRGIARFNSLLISGQDPVATFGDADGVPAVPDEIGDDILGSNLDTSDSALRPTRPPEEPTRTQAAARTGIDETPPCSHDSGVDPSDRRVWRNLHCRRLLGSGAYGEVYVAWDPRLEREVALKLYRTEEPDMPTAGHVIREGQLMAKVRHPNVVSVFGADKDETGRVGIWMDYIRGKTLSAVLREQGPLGPREAELIGLDLCQALAAVHAQGIVHQDVKGQNVMREQGGQTILMDFGVGVELGRDFAQTPLQAAGTPYYMAPEALIEGNVSEVSDIYSLGVLLFHLVTNRFPVEAGSMGGLIAAHAESHNLLRDLRPGLPKSFIDVVEKALDPDPKQRYQTMGQMETALAQSLGTDVPRRDAPHRSRPTNARRGPWIAFSLILVGILAVGSFLLWRPGRLLRGTPDEGPVQALLPASSQEVEPALDLPGTQTAGTAPVAEATNGYGYLVRAVDFGGRASLRAIGTGGSSVDIHPVGGSVGLWRVLHQDGDVRLELQHTGPANPRPHVVRVESEKILGDTLVINWHQQTHRWK